MATQARRRSRPKADQETQPASGRRPFWSGTISFGLVSVPVDLFPATRSESIPMRMLAPDGAPLRRRYFDPRNDKDVDYRELVRGYEVGQDEFVPLTDEELQSVEPRKSRDIDLRLFVALDEVDPALFINAYVLIPSGNSTKPYRLLCDIMEREHKVGIATAVMRDKEYLMAIFAQHGILYAETLRFADELRKPDDLELPKHVEPSPALVKGFERAIASLEKPGVSEKELVDRRLEKLRALVDRKLRSNKDVIERESEAEPEGEDEEGATPEDLFETIRRSLASAGKAVAREPRSARGARQRTGNSPSTARTRARAKPASRKSRRRR